MLEVKWKEKIGMVVIKSSTSFNPCYVGSKMERAVLHVQDKVDPYVSILVMLEVKWKVKQGKVGATKLLCFNPCYVGSKMESLIGMI